MSSASGSRWGRFLSVLMLAVVTMALMVLSACGEDSATEASSEPTVLRMAAVHELDTWDPRRSYGDEVTWLANVYEPLLWANPPGSAEPFSPALAMSWEVSDDGLVWTFHLREGVTFHDGAPFNAEAVKYSIDATKEVGLGASYIWAPVEEVKVIDDFTVQLVCSYPAPMDYCCSSMYAAWIFSPNTKGKDESWWNAPNEAGTGPWMLESYQPAEEVVLTRYPDYWGGWQDNQYTQVVTKMVQDQNTQRQMLEAGEVDCANQLSYDSLPAMQNNPDVKIAIIDSVLTDIMMFNTQRAPLDNPKVRQALSYAVPYDEIITVGANGYAKQSRGPVPAGLWPNDAALTQYSHDLERARQLLAEVGYEDGFKLNLTYATDDAFAPKFVANIKEAYAEIGVEVNLQGLLFNQGWAKAKGSEDRRQDIWIMMWWPGYPHGIDNLYPLFHSEAEVVFNLSYYSNEKYDTLIDTAYSTEATDREEAARLYSEAQQLLIDEAPAAYLFDAQLAFGYLPSLTLDDMALNPNYTKVLFWYHATH